MQLAIDLNDLECGAMAQFSPNEFVAIQDSQQDGVESFPSLVGIDPGGIMLGMGELRLQEAGYQSVSVPFSRKKWGELQPVHFDYEQRGWQMAAIATLLIRKACQEMQSFYRGPVSLLLRVPDGCEHQIAIAMYPWVCPPSFQQVRYVSDTATIEKCLHAADLALDQCFGVWIDDGEIVIWQAHRSGKRWTVSRKRNLEINGVAAIQDLILSKLLGRQRYQTLKVSGRGAVARRKFWLELKKMLSNPRSDAVSWIPLYPADPESAVALNPTIAKAVIADIRNELCAKITAEMTAMDSSGKNMDVLMLGDAGWIVGNLPFRTHAFDRASILRCLLDQADDIPPANLFLAPFALSVRSYAPGSDEATYERIFEKGCVLPAEYTLHRKGSREGIRMIRDKLFAHFPGHSSPVLYLQMRVGPLVDWKITDTAKIHIIWLADGSFQVRASHATSGQYLPVQMQFMYGEHTLVSPAQAHELSVSG